jgi:hypothetical protein
MHSLEPLPFWVACMCVCVYAHMHKYAHGTASLVKEIMWLQVMILCILYKIYNILHTCLTLVKYSAQLSRHIISDYLGIEIYSIFKYNNKTSDNCFGKVLFGFYWFWTMWNPVFSVQWILLQLCLNTWLLR